MEELDQDEWVDLSVDDLSKVMEGLIAEDNDSSFEGLSDDEDEGGQQVIAVDTSVPDLYSSERIIPQMLELESKNSELSQEKENLLKKVAELKTLIQNNENEWRQRENERLEHETELATKQVLEANEKAELELNMVKTQAMNNDVQKAREMTRLTDRALAAEKLAEALKLELSGYKKSAQAELAAHQEAMSEEKIKTKRDAKSSEQLINDLMAEVEDLRNGLQQSQLKQTNMKRSVTQGEHRLRRELEQCRRELRESKDNYENLLKTLAETKEPTEPKQTGGLTYEDRAVLGQACREASRALAFVDEVETKSPAAASGGGLSQSVMDVIGEKNEDTPSSAALSVRKLSDALMAAHNGKVAIERFNVGEVAMFFPIPKKGDGKQEYVAFSAKRNKEKHFLADESKDLIGKSQHFKEAYVLGRVVHKELLVADEQCKRLCLKPGTNYYSVTVSALPFD